MRRELPKMIDQRGNHHLVERMPGCTQSAEFPAARVQQQWPERPRVMLDVLPQKNGELELPRKEIRGDVDQQAGGAVVDLHLGVHAQDDLGRVLQLLSAAVAGVVALVKILRAACAARADGKVQPADDAPAHHPVDPRAPQGAQGEDGAGVVAPAVRGIQGGASRRWRVDRERLLIEEVIARVVLGDHIDPLDLHPGGGFQRQCPGPDLVVALQGKEGQRGARNE